MNGLLALPSLKAERGIDQGDCKLATSFTYQKMKERSKILIKESIIIKLR